MVLLGDALPLGIARHSTRKTFFSRHHRRKRLIFLKKWCVGRYILSSRGKWTKVSTEQEKQTNHWTEKIQNLKTTKGVCCCSGSLDGNPYFWRSSVSNAALLNNYEHTLSSKVRDNSRSHHLRPAPKHEICKVDAEDAGSCVFYVTQQCPQVARTASLQQRQDLALRSTAVYPRCQSFKSVSNPSAPRHQKSRNVLFKFDATVAVVI